MHAKLYLIFKMKFHLSNENQTLQSEPLRIDRD